MPWWKMINSECHATDKITPILFNFSKRQNINQAEERRRRWKHATLQGSSEGLAARQGENTWQIPKPENAEVTRQQEESHGGRIGQMIDLFVNVNKTFFKTAKMEEVQIWFEEKFFKRILQERIAFKRRNARENRGERRKANSRLRIAFKTISWRRNSANIFWWNRSVAP